MNISLRTRQNKDCSALCFLPEAYSVAKWCVSVAIFSMDRGAVTEEVLDKFEVTLAGSDM